ncbi:MAG TPA: hypothetical protein VNJ08_06075 [Bacteriovoracaceae bacterium]|nr:hypothetical protein [Bacteriovoracaceae bacterium]
MKTKNPLYVVKGKTVLEARGVVDLILKKFNLEPAVEILMKIATFLLSQVKDYPTFLAIKKIVDDMMELATKIGNKFHKA